ncbi:MAG: T9SS type A sorting domain-containing protein [Candidatus Zhuqueibacterota bacterium]
MKKSFVSQLILSLAICIIFVVPANSAWIQKAFPLRYAITDSFVVEMNAQSPLAALDGGFSLLKSATPMAFNDHAALVQFSVDNVLKVRNGDSYTKDVDIPYTPGESFFFRITGNVKTSKYSVWVTPEGGTETQLAANYTFRTAQVGVDSLRNWGLFYDDAIGFPLVSNVYIAYSPAGGDWVHTNITSLNMALTDSFTVEMDVEPAMLALDGGIGICKTDNPVTWNDYACLVQFATDNFIKVRNGGTYAKVADVTYEPFKIYHVKISGDILTSTYSVWVTPPEGAETLIADSYQFRTAQIGVDSLRNWGAFYNTRIGPAKAYNVYVTHKLPQQWVYTNNHPLGVFLTQTFVVELDVTPFRAGLDGGVGISKSNSPAQFNDFACLVQFAADNFIKARNGNTYAKDVDIPYEPGKPYHLRIGGDIPASLYDVWVTPPDGSEMLLANDYTFRTAQIGVDSLRNVGVFYSTTSGPAMVSNIKVAKEYNTGIEVNAPGQIADFELLQNYPNPFNPTTEITYSLPEAGLVKLTVYNLLGQKIKTLVDKTQLAGLHTIAWDGSDMFGKSVAGGVYFYEINAGTFKQVKKMLYLK